MLPEMSAKHVELLKAAVPSLNKLAVLWNPINTSHRPALQAVEAAALSLSLQVCPLEVKGPAELDSIFGVISREKSDGFLFIADPVFFINLKRMVDFAASSRLPAIANFIEFPKLGGLMGYAPSIPDEFQHAAGHIDKILKGAEPPQFYLSSCRRGFSSLSILRPLGRSASPCHRRCSPPPTR
jgi:putative ABC transport system substrate-binding protein